MRRFAIGLCGLLVLSLAAAVHAEEPTSEKKAASEKAYKELSEFLMADGGVWKATIKLGEYGDEGWKPTGGEKKVEHEYHWVGDGRFLQRTSRTNGEISDTVLILGVDPVSGEVTWWRFGKGGLTPVVNKKQKDGIWTYGGTFNNAEGHTISWKRTMTLKDDEIITTYSASVDGVQNPQEAMKPPTIEKRHKK